jgi:hypothetical protein
LERREEKGAELEVLASGIADDANQLDRVAAARVARVEFVLALANALGNALEGVFEAMADLIFEQVPLEGAQALDLFEGFVVPTAQGGARDGELSRDGVEGKALGAQFDELVFGFDAVHKS